MRRKNLEKADFIAMVLFAAGMQRRALLNSHYNTRYQALGKHKNFRQTLYAGS